MIMYELIAPSQWSDGDSFLRLAEETIRNHLRHLIWRSTDQSPHAGGGAQTTWKIHAKYNDKS